MRNQMAASQSSLLQRFWGKYSVPQLASWGVRFAFRLVTSGLRSLPDFLIIGAQRCGTTSLYNYLAAHPGVRPAFLKEAHFFDMHYGKGRYWYRAFFPLVRHRQGTRQGAHAAFLTGEATPYYLFHPHVPERAFALLPTARLIVLLRNPVDRALSHFHHEVKQGFEPRTFEEAVTADLASMADVRMHLEQNKGLRSFEHAHHSYVARGIYADQLLAWLKWFPREQILVLSSEAFYQDPAKMLSEAVQFLGLPPWAPDRFPRYNVNQYSEMDASIRQLLRSYYAPHNQRLYQLLNIDFGW